jgi:hypothetical protein
LIGKGDVAGALIIHSKRDAVEDWEFVDCGAWNVDVVGSHHALDSTPDELVSEN